MARFGLSRFCSVMSAWSQIPDSGVRYSPAKVNHRNREQRKWACSCPDSSSGGTLLATRAGARARKPRKSRNYFETPRISKSTRISTCWKWRSGGDSNYWFTFISNSLKSRAYFGRNSREENDGADSEASAPKVNHGEFGEMESVLFGLQVCEGTIVRYPRRNTGELQAHWSFCWRTRR